MQGGQSAKPRVTRVIFRVLECLDAVVGDRKDDIRWLLRVVHDASRKKVVRISEWCSPGGSGHVLREAYDRGSLKALDIQSVQPAHGS